MILYFKDKRYQKKLVPFGNFETFLFFKKVERLAKPLTPKGGTYNS